MNCSKKMIIIFLLLLINNIPLISSIKSNNDEKITYYDEIVCLYADEIKYYNYSIPSNGTCNLGIHCAGLNGSWFTVAFMNQSQYHTNNISDCQWSVSASQFTHGAIYPYGLKLIPLETYYVALTTFDNSCVEFSLWITCYYYSFSFNSTSSESPTTLTSDTTSSTSATVVTNHQTTSGFTIAFFLFLLPFVFFKKGKYLFEKYQ